MNMLKLLQGIALFSTFVLVMIGGASDITTNYNITTGDALSDTFSKTAELNELSNDMSVQLQSGNVEDADLLSSLYRGAITAVKMVASVPSMVFDLLRDMEDRWGIPVWLVPLVILLLIIYIVGVLIQSSTGRSLTDE